MATSESLQFYRCSHCGNIVQMIAASGVPVVCCGEPMDRLLANTVEASHEKHVPVVRREGDVLRVDVGSAPHPMLAEHFIEWIALQTDRGFYRRLLSPGEEPHAQFTLLEETPVAVYAYCNLHGLWKTAF